MKRVFINEVDFTNRVEIDLSFVEKLNRELDEGYVSIPHTLRKRTFNMYDIVDIYDDDDIVFSGRVARDRVSVASYNDRLFNHEISLIEHTKILEKYIVKGKTFTKPILITSDQPYDLLDVVTILRETTPLELLGNQTSYRPFNIPQETAELLSGVIAPEFNFKDLTLRQALDQVASVLDSIVRIDRNGDLFLTQFDKLKEKIDFVTQSYNIERGLNDYATVVESEMLNAVYTENFDNPEFQEVYPNEPSYTTLRSDEFLFGFGERAFIPTPRPIYAVNDLKALVRATAFKSVDGNVVDSFSGWTEISLKSRVIEYEAWSALDIERNNQSPELKKTDVFFQNNTIYFNYARKNIFVGELYGLFDTSLSFDNVIYAAGIEEFKERGLFPPEMTSSPYVDGNTTYVLEDVIARTKQELEKGEFFFRVYYTPIPSSLRFQVERDSVKEVNFYSEAIVNQQTRIIDVQRFANNLKGRVNKMGNSVMQLSHRVQNYNESYNIGDFIIEEDEIYVVTQKESILYRDFWILNYELTKNYNNFSQFMGIDSEIRQSEVAPVNRTVERDLLYTEYVEVEANNGGEGSNDILTLVDKDAVINTFNPSVTHEPIRSALINVDNVGDTLVVGLNKLYGGNTLSFNFELEDNISAGNQLVPDDGNIFAFLERRYNKPTAYADDTGRFTSLKFRAYDTPIDLPLPTQLSEEDELVLVSNELPVVNEDDFDSLTPNIEAEFYVKKDNREKIKFNLMYSFLPKNAEELVIGGKFVEFNGLVTKGENNVQLWIYDNRRFDISDKNKSLEAPDTVISSPNLTFDTTDNKIVINDQISQGQSYALVNDEGFPYVMVNSNKTHLLFHFRNKRSGVQYLGLKPVFLFLESNAEATSELEFVSYQALNFQGEAVANSQLEFTAYQALTLNSTSSASSNIEFETVIFKVETIDLQSNSECSSDIDFKAILALNLNSNSIANSQLNFTADPILPPNQIWVTDTSVASVWQVTVNLGLVSTCPTQQEGLSIIESNAPANNQDVGDRGRIIAAQEDNGAFIPCTERRYRVELE